MNYEYDEILQLLVDKMEGRDTLSWQEIVEEFNLDVNKDSLRKSFGGRFGGYEVYNYLKSHSENNSTSKQIERYEHIRDEAYRERIRLQDSRREINKYHREYARQEHLIECLKDCMDELPDLESKFILDSTYADNTDKSASIIVSDIHDGILIDNLFNYYDKEIVEKRMNQLADKVIGICLEQKVKILNVELCGDLIAGAIHTSIRVEQEEDLISAIIHVSEVLSNFIAKIKKIVPQVNVYGVCGNHARVQSKLSDNINRENYERLIFEYIKLRLPEIPVYQNGWEDFLKYEINGRKIVLTHGDKDTVENVRNHCCNLFGEVVDEVHMGHTHHFNIKDDNGTMIVVNGSVMSTDSYATKIRQIVKPYQIMRVYGNNDCTYRIQLD